jgi:riboflavin kinase / FMN adenylyltransferase
MRIARSAAEAAGFGPSVLTIGNFDGVHIGHQHLFRSVCEAAKAIGAHPAVLTFDPHPARVVAPERTPRLLTTVDQRCALMAEQGIEQVLVLPFTLEIARLTPEEFVGDFVAGAMKARVVMVGENFRFGHKQAGDTRVLATLGERYGFETRIIPAVECRGRVASSSEIRKLITAGDAGMAWRFLNRPYSIAGEVVSGRGVGSKQTVPTLNLKTSAEVLPKVGVYVTRTRDLADGRKWNSITNIGYRPTFAEERDPPLSIETFLLESLDGPAPEGILESDAPKRIEVEFLHFVRDERRFENVDALKAQILLDVRRAGAFFRHSGRVTRT